MVVNGTGVASKKQVKKKFDSVTLQALVGFFSIVLPCFPFCFRKAVGLENLFCVLGPKAASFCGVELSALPPLPGMRRDLLGSVQPAPAPVGKTLSRSIPAPRHHPTPLSILPTEGLLHQRTGRAGFLPAFCLGGGFVGQDAACPGPGSHLPALGVQCWPPAWAGAAFML